MIILLILLDILVYNYTHYVTYFFIIGLYNKNVKYYFFTGLFLDLIIFKYYLINTIILLIIYLLNKIFIYLIKNNIFNYLFINIFNYIIYIVLSNIMVCSNLTSILYKIGISLFINIVGYALLYKTISN